MSTDLQRVTVNLIPKAADSLDRLAERTTMSKTDVINRALQLYDFIDGVTAGGGDVLVRPKDGATELLKLI